MNRPFTAALATTGLAACALVAATQGTADNATAAAVTPATQGLITVRDAESGALRAPTADEAARYTTPAARAPAAQTLVRRADGSLSARVDDSHMIYSTVSRKADGTWARHCGLDPDHAEHAQAAQREVE